MLLSGWQLFSINQLTSDLLDSLQMEKRRERENFWLWKNYNLLWNGVKIEMSLLLQVEETHRTT